MQRLSIDNSHPIFIFCALACEAKAIIDHFDLKKNPASGLFDHYRHNNLNLTVTGIGKANMAAGIAYTLALSNHPQSLPILINIGIAGHQDAELGSLFAAHKITDYDSNKRYYPQLPSHLPCPSLALETVSLPQQNYAPSTLYDMEASAFYEIAARFSCSELILSLKVVSDNAASTISNINANQVKLWLGQHLSSVSHCLTLLVNRVKCLPYSKEDIFEQLTSGHHFTVSEQVQLKALLARWQIVSGGDDLSITPATYKSTRAFLESLNEQINRLPLIL